MKALGKKKRNHELLAEIKSHSFYNPQVKKVMLKSISKGVINVFKFKNIFGEPSQRTHNTDVLS